MAKKAVNPTQMTEVIIDGKNYPLIFGLDFIRTLDKIYFLDRDGLKFGAGLIQARIGLMQGNPLTLQEIVMAATCTHKPAPPRPEAIELWLYEQDMEQLAQDFLAYLKKSPATTLMIQKLEKAEEELNDA